MTQFRTFTVAEREALLRHGLRIDQPSQLSDAFVLGMRYRHVPDWKATHGCTHECREGVRCQCSDEAKAASGVGLVDTETFRASGTDGATEEPIAPQSKQGAA